MKSLIGLTWIVVILGLGYIFFKLKYRDFLYDQRGPVFCGSCRWACLDKAHNELYCIHPRETKHGESCTFADLKNRDYACIDYEGTE